MEGLTYEGDDRGCDDANVVVLVGDCRARTEGGVRCGPLAAAANSRKGRNKRTEAKERVATCL